MMMVLVLTVGLGAALAGTEPRGEPPGELPTTIAPDAVFALGGVRPASFTQAEPVRLASDGPIPRWFDGTVGLAYPDTSGGDAGVALRAGGGGRAGGAVPGGRGGGFAGGAAR